MGRGYEVDVVGTLFLQVEHHRKKLFGAEFVAKAEL